MRIYVAGPMTGIPDFNYPAFRKAALELSALGHEVENPADNDDGAQESWADYMRLAIPQMLSCEGVALLDGWLGSKGAALEVHIAEALGMDVRPIDSWIDPTRLAVGTAS